MQTGLRILAGVGALLALALAGGYGRLSARLPATETDAERLAGQLAWPDPPAAAALSVDASVFKKYAGDAAADTLGPLAKRFRLAGTFFAIGNNQHARHAIIDDLQKKEQQLVTEGDRLDAVLVVSIFPERVIVRDGGRDEELRLSFSDARALPAGSKQNPAPAAGSAQLLNRFGKRVGEARWLLQRDELLKYYTELLNNTERLAKVFDSLKPVYKSNKIAGYVLQVEGEADLFSAVGLQENDVIRSVNKMPMTSQARAEYFIREFVNNRVNGFVLDIEREGKPGQLIYLVR